MTPKVCKYGCNVMLDAWDDEAKKYREAGSGGLHTKERCEEMKAKSRQQQGEHNNHGNENGDKKKLYLNQETGETKLLTQAQASAENKNYVDHTQGIKEKLKLKILTSTEAEGLSLLYNTFGESHTIRFSQYQIAGSLYTIAVFFEEIKQ